MEMVKIDTLRLSLEKISEDLAIKTVKNRKNFQNLNLFYINFDFSPFIPGNQN
uniref:Uncharacterized protein n=1 Tax=Solanum lycopersicum TaxID=4081 RepID=A0A3Q7GI75_SOLLC